MPQLWSNFQSPDGMLESFRLHQANDLPFTLAFKHGKSMPFPSSFLSEKELFLSKIAFTLPTSTI